MSPSNSSFPPAGAGDCRYSPRGGALGPDPRPPPPAPPAAPPPPARPPSICILSAMISVVNRSLPCLSCHLRVRSLPSTNTCDPLRRYSAAISPDGPKSAMLCHSVRSCCAPEAFSFQDSLVAIRILVTVMPLGMERVSGSAPRFPTRITLLTPRAISFPRLDSMPHIVHGEPGPTIAVQARNDAEIRAAQAPQGVLPTLDAARIVIG